MNRRPFRDSILISIIGAILYLSLLAANYDSNGIIIARRVEVSYVASPNHMFFELTGVVLMHLAAFLGQRVPVFPMLQVLAALFGAAALGATNLAARRLNAARLEALAASAWLGTTYAFWKWSTNVAYVSAGAMLAAFAVALLWGRKSIATQMTIGVLAACSALSWQANIFLFPVLIAGICFQAATWDDRVKETKYVFGAYAVTLALAYFGMVYQSGFRDAHQIFKLVTTYGGGGGPDWGHWGWERIGSLAATWLQSVIGIRFNTVFPRLAPFALVAFLVPPLLLVLWRWKDRAAAFCLLGIAAYLPFIIWWDPFETKWMLVPNLFIAIGAARYWSQLSLRFPSSSRLLMWIAVFVLGLSNLVSFGLPEHQHPSEMQQAGDCVGTRLRSADLYISPEWDFGEFMSYKYKKDSMNLVGRTVELHYDKAKTVEAIKEEVRKHQASGGDVYISDPLSRHFDLLQQWAGITSSDLDQLLPGQIAYRCAGWSIRKIERLNLDKGTQ
jgi:hypothetical protein